MPQKISIPHTLSVALVKQRKVKVKHNLGTSAGRVDDIHGICQHPKSPCLLGEVELLDDRVVRREVIEFICEILGRSARLCGIGLLDLGINALGGTENSKLNGINGSLFVLRFAPNRECGPNLSQTDYSIYDFVSSFLGRGVSIPLEEDSDDKSEHNFSISVLPEDLSVQQMSIRVGYGTKQWKTLFNVDVFGNDQLWATTGQLTSMWCKDLRKFVN